MNAAATYPRKGSFDYWVLSALQRGQKLTVLGVAQEIGIISLPQAVCRLRKAGYHVLDEWKPCQGDSYRPSRYKVFFLESANNHNQTGG